MWLFCEGCIQVRQGTRWKHVLSMCRVRRDQEFIEMNVNIALHGSWCHHQCASQTDMDQQSTCFSVFCFALFFVRTFVLIALNLAHTLFCFTVIFFQQLSLHRTFLTLHFSSCYFFVVCAAIHLM